MQKAGFIGRPLDQMLQEGMRLAYDKHMDQSAYVGLSEYGTTGLLNHSEAAETTVKDNGAAAPSTKWKDKTPRQMLDDVNGAILSVWEAEEYDLGALPNHILLPHEQYAHILNTPVTELATETILDYILKNNVAAKNGGSLYIGATRWCKGAGTGGADRMAVYVNHERFIKMDELVPLARVMTAPTPPRSATTPPTWPTSPRCRCSIPSPSCISTAFKEALIKTSKSATGIIVTTAKAVK